MDRIKDMTLLSNGRPVEIHAWAERVIPVHALTMAALDQAIKVAASGRDPIGTAIRESFANCVVCAVIDGSDLQWREVDELTIGDLFNLFIAICRLNTEILQASMCDGAATPKAVKL